MSAFVVEDQIINRVVWFLANDRDSDDIRHTVLEELDCNLATEDGQRQLGEAMFNLNCRGVEERYGAGSAKDFRELNYSYRPEIHTNAIQALKSLQCWHYQCCEGNVPDESLLYSAMDRIAGYMALDIVRNLPAWDKAKW